MQGPGEAAAVRLGDEVEGAGSGGGAESAVLDIHDGALRPVLVEDRPVGVSRGRVNQGVALAKFLTWYHTRWFQRSTGKCRGRMALVGCAAAGG